MKKDEKKNDSNALKMKEKDWTMKPFPTLQGLSIQEIENWELTTEETEEVVKSQQRGVCKTKPAIQFQL